MKCPEFETLMLMLDGELSGDQLKDVVHHVETCQRCSDIIGSQVHLETLWRDSLRVPDADKFREIEQRLFERMHRRSRSRWWTVIPVAASIAAVLLGVKLILTDKPSIEDVTGHSMYRSSEDLSAVERMEDFELPAASQPAFGADPVEVETHMETEIFLEQETSEDIEPETPEDADLFRTIDISEEITSLSKTADLGYPESEYAGELSEYTSRGVTEELVDTYTGSAAGGINRIAGGEMVLEEEESQSADDLVFEGDELCQQVASTGQLLHNETVDSTNGQGLTAACTMTASSDERSEETEMFQVADGSVMSEDSARVRSLGSAKLMNAELFFNAKGEPDSITALLLDSLIPEWHEYIPFTFRDTALIVPLADIQDLLINENYEPAELNE